MRLKVVGCSDPMMWYSGMVGEELPLASESEDVYWSFETSPPHCKNIVLKQDAVLVDEC